MQHLRNGKTYMTKAELMDTAEASKLSHKPIKGAAAVSYHGGPATSMLPELPIPCSVGAERDLATCMVSTYCTGYKMYQHVHLQFIGSGHTALSILLSACGVNQSGVAGFTYDGWSSFSSLVNREPPFCVQYSNPKKIKLTADVSFSALNFTFTVWVHRIAVCEHFGDNEHHSCIEIKTAMLEQVNIAHAAAHTECVKPSVHVMHSV